jgi:hypothetical protein
MTRSFQAPKKPAPSPNNKPGGWVDPARVLNRSGYIAERGRLLKAEIESRQAVERKRKNNLLTPSDVAGEFNFNRALITSLGGTARPITLDDLRQFELTANALGRKFVKKGITAQQVINFSNPEDRKRSTAEILIAPLVRAQTGMLTFVTNAGPESKRTRHLVRVRFPAFDAYAASPAKDKEADAKRLAKAMLGGPLQFDCTCERHRYVFRYIATRGGFNIPPPIGRAETAFPKITNPKLEGIGCKHVLRVMQQIAKGTTVVPTVAKMLKAVQDKAQAITVSPTEARAVAERQARQAGWKSRAVESEKERERRLTPTQKAKLATMQRSASRARDLAAESRKAGQASIDDAIRRIRALPIPVAQKDAAIAAIRAAQT